MLVIKFAQTKHKNKNDHENTKREPLWYVVNDKGEMIVKPEVSLPKETDFLPDLTLVGLARLGTKEIDISTKPNEIKKTIVRAVIDGRVVHTFENINYDLIDNEKSLGRTPCEEPEFTVVVSSRGERACWDKGVEMMYFEE